jgi:hypothetical protein
MSNCQSLVRIEVNGGERISEVKPMFTSEKSQEFHKLFLKLFLETIKEKLKWSLFHQHSLSKWLSDSLCES